MVLASVVSKAAAVGLLVCGLPASGALADVAPPNAAKQITVSISGHITPKCEIERIGLESASFGSIMDTRTGRAAPAHLDLPFHLTCNAPYTATLRSRNGGLSFDGTTARGFAALVEYHASIGLSSAAGGVSLSCNSTAMRASSSAPGARSACKGASNGRGYSDGDGQVHLNLIGGGQPLLKGTYSDQLILSVTPGV